MGSKTTVIFYEIWRSRNSLHLKYMLTMCLHFNSNTYIVSIFINAFTICPRDVIIFKNINDAQFSKNVRVCVVQMYDNTQPLHNLKPLDLFLLIVIFRESNTFGLYCYLIPDFYYLSCFVGLCFVALFLIAHKYG